MPIVYTVLIALSAGVVTFAACSLVAFIYPSMKLFFPNQSGALPYGATMAIVVLLFLLACYVTPLVVLAGFVMLGVLANHAVRPLPEGALAVAAVLAAAMALFGDVERVREVGVDGWTGALVALYVLVPLVASLACKSTDDTAPFSFTALVLLAAAAAGPLLTGEMTHGTPAALVMLCAVLAMRVRHAKAPGSLGIAGLVPLVIALSHITVVLAHAGAKEAALVIAAVMLVGYLALGARRA